MIPYSRQKIFNEDIKEVVKVLKSDFLTKGKKVIEFENNFSKTLKARYAISCNSGSSALLLACKSLNLKKNDLVWTVPNTYAASANCAIECGAKIDFVDIDPKSWNISIKQLTKKLKYSKLKNKLSSRCLTNLSKLIAANLSSKILCVFHTPYLSVYL